MLSRRQTLAGIALSAASDCLPAHGQPKVDTVPLPPTMTLNMQPPGPSLPADMAAFIGKWGGKWQPGDLVSNLYVENVDPSGVAKVIYAWDTNYNTQRGAFRSTAQIAKGTLSWGTGTKFEFKTMPDGTLKASRYSGDRSNSAIMTRMT